MEEDLYRGLGGDVGSQEMNANDAGRVLEAMFLWLGRGTGRAQPNPFVGVLQELAREAKIEEVAEACSVFFRLGWGPRRIIEKYLAAIILNQYVLRVGRVDFERFRAWEAENPGWANRIRENASSRRLYWIVEHMMTSIRDFEPRGIIVSTGTLGR